jgi:hypothetical protein
MDVHAGSPEELETLLEDAVLLRDGAAAAQLFEPDGVIVPWPGSAQVRGRAAIAELAAGLSSDGPGYLADPRHVTLGADLALIVSPSALNVARRRRNGSWRFVISLQQCRPPHRQDVPE